MIAENADNAFLAANMRHECVKMIHHAPEFAVHFKAIIAAQQADIGVNGV